MSRNALEAVLGAVVLAVAVGFLLFAHERTSFATGVRGGYELSARFSSVGSLDVGAPVRLSGISIGAVTDQTLDPETYEAVVTFSVEERIRLPVDSFASVTTDGLLGGTFLRLEPGGDEEMLNPGDEIANTQAAGDLLRLLSRMLSNRD